MKIDETEPTRFQDAGPDALRELVRSHQAGPGDDVVERMSTRLDAALASAPASRGFRGGVGRRFAPYKLTAVALAIAGTFVLSWEATRLVSSDVGGEAVPASALEPSRADPVATTTVREPTPAQTAEATATATASLPVHLLPSAPPPSTSAPTGSRARAPSGALADQGSAAELDLIQRAQTELVSNPQRALAVTSEHARAYPAGEFVQEREVIAVEALAKLGRRDEAVGRALALTKAFPNTPYATRLAKAIGRPISAPISGPERSTNP